MKRRKTNKKRHVFCPGFGQCSQVSGLAIGQRPDTGHGLEMRMLGRKRNHAGTSQSGLFHQSDASTSLGRQDWLFDVSVVFCSGPILLSAAYNLSEALSPGWAGLVDLETLRHRKIQRSWMSLTECIKTRGKELD